jgi:hypothetical protein
MKGLVSIWWNAVSFSHYFSFTPLSQPLTEPAEAALCGKTLPAAPEVEDTEIINRL